MSAGERYPIFRHQVPLSIFLLFGRKNVTNDNTTLLQTRLVAVEETDIVEDKERRREDRFLIIHCLFGEPVRYILIQIRTFLRQNPGELVILDLQHLYNFNQRSEEELLNLVFSILGDCMCPPPGPEQNLAQFTLKYLLEMGYQVPTYLPDI